MSLDQLLIEDLRGVNNGFLFLFQRPLDFFDCDTSEVIN